MPVLRGGVHLHDVDVAALDDGAAVDAFLVEIERRVPAGLVLVVEGAGEDAGGGGFADAADAGEDEGMMDAVLGERVLQRLHHRVLADERRKSSAAGISARAPDRATMGRRGPPLADQRCGGISPGEVFVAHALACGQPLRVLVGGWHRPVKVSLGLLPSGPDPVGEEHVRANLPRAISGRIGAMTSPSRQVLLSVSRG